MQIRNVPHRLNLSGPKSFSALANGSWGAWGVGRLRTASKNAATANARAPKWVLGRTSIGDSGTNLACLSTTFSFRTQAWLALGTEGGLASTVGGSETATY